MDADAVVALVIDDLLPKWQHERQHLDRIDRWARWEHDKPHKPRDATAEYKELSARAESPWGDLLVGSIAQTLYVEGYRRPSSPDDGTGWRYWQANGMDARQIPLHRASLTYGLAYTTVLPGKTLGGEPMPTIRAASPREMIAFYEDIANDEWPLYALRISKVKGGHLLRFFDDEAVHVMRVENLGDKPNTPKVEEHGAGICPVVRYPNRFDLEGRSAGEIEPFIPLLGRIDQDIFDRLVVQRFAAWIVRTIAGMSMTETTTATGETAQQAKLRLKVEDVLVAEDKDTKFDSLPASPLGGFIESHDADVRELSAVSQSPSFEMLGQMANLSAEALDAAKDSQRSKSDEHKHTLGEFHEQTLRLSAHMAGDEEGAADFEAQVRWKDTDLRSLAQVADAFGKLTTTMGVPPEVLLPKIPSFSQQDVDQALSLMKQSGMHDLFTQLVQGQLPPSGQ